LFFIFNCKILWQQLSNLAGSNIAVHRSHRYLVNSPMRYLAWGPRAMELVLFVFCSLRQLFS